MDAYEELLSYKNTGIFVSSSNFIDEQMCKRIIDEGIPTVLFAEI